MDHIDGICESVDVQYSSNEIIKQLTGKEDITVSYPRLIGKRLAALDGFEVESFYVDLESISLNLKWTKQEGRWHRITKRESHHLQSTYSIFPSEEILGWHIAKGEVECNNSAIGVVHYRQLTFFFPDCPVTELWRIYRGDLRFMYWCFQLNSRGRIPKNDIPRLRAELTELGADADDVVPRMVISDDMRFNVRSFIRVGSRGNWASKPFGSFIRRSESNSGEFTSLSAPRGGAGQRPFSRLPRVSRCIIE